MLWGNVGGRWRAEGRGREGGGGVNPPATQYPLRSPRWPLWWGSGTGRGSEPRPTPSQQEGISRVGAPAWLRVGAWVRGPVNPKPSPGGVGKFRGGGAGGVGRSGPWVGGGAQRGRAEGAGRGGGPQTTEVSFPVLYYCPPPTTKGSCSLQRALPKNTNPPRPKTAFRCVWFLLDALIVLT